MALQLYGFHGRPHDIAATKQSFALEDCVFLLDFSRPLNRLRWLGKFNRWLGFTAGLLVPVIHQTEQSGRYVINVSRGEPYFAEIPNLWKEHYGSKRTIVTLSIDELEIIVDFANHFPEDCN